jgi:hypothetical protein
MILFPVLILALLILVGVPVWMLASGFVRLSDGRAGAVRVLVGGLWLAVLGAGATHVCSPHRETVVGRGTLGDGREWCYVQHCMRPGRFRPMNYGGMFCTRIASNRWAAVTVAQFVQPVGALDAATSKSGRSVVLYRPVAAPDAETVRSALYASVVLPPADLDPDESGVVRRETDDRTVEESWLVFPASDTPEDILVRIRDQRSAMMGRRSLQSARIDSPLRLERPRTPSAAEETHAENAETAEPKPHAESAEQGEGSGEAEPSPFVAPPPAP